MDGAWVCGMHSLHKLHDDTKDKPFELELAVLSSSTKWLFKAVPKETMCVPSSCSLQRYHGTNTIRWDTETEFLVLWYSVCAAPRPRRGPRLPSKQRTWTRTTTRRRHEWCTGGGREVGEDSTVSSEARADHTRTPRDGPLGSRKRKQVLRTRHVLSLFLLPLSSGGREGKFGGSHT